MDEPWLWFIAGINGAGKTTLAKELEARGVFSVQRWLNPDQLARELIAGDGDLEDDWASARATLLIEAQVHDCICRRESCAVETVLSHDHKYQDLVPVAQSEGVRVGMIYVALSTVELAIQRVAQRVALGGHNVEEDKIRSRWGRSLDNLAWFARRIDALYVFCNDRACADPELWGYLNQGDFIFVGDGLPDLKSRLQEAVTLS